MAIRFTRTVVAFACANALRGTVALAAQTGTAAAIPPPPHVDAAPPEAKRTKTGLATLVLQRGNGGGHPTPADIVIVNFTGWTSDGRMFDSTVGRGAPAHLFVASAVPGLVEALQLMEPGEVRRVWVPQWLAARSDTSGPTGALVFDVELIDVPRLAERQPPGLTPDRRAATTASGLAYLLLRPGTGSGQPSGESRVTLDMSGWTADQKLFVSSNRAAPLTLTFRQLGNTFPGLAEGLRLMHEGEKTRFWIPENLAYKPSGIKGPLVLDLYLFRVEKDDTHGVEPPGARGAAAPSLQAAGRPSDVLRPGGSVTWPSPVHEEKPRYTSDAMRSKINGAVVLEGIVRPDGTVTDVRIIRSLDPLLGLDEEAVKAARQWRFRPSMRDGEPVSVYVTIELQFAIR